jgi:predicted DNA-binding protein
MLVRKQYRLVMTPERKKMLDFLAKHEGRSKANLLNRLIVEKYETVQAAKQTDKNHSMVQPVVMARPN